MDHSRLTYRLCVPRSCRHHWRRWDGSWFLCLEALHSNHNEQWNGSGHLWFLSARLSGKSGKSHGDVCLAEPCFGDLTGHPDKPCQKGGKICRWHLTNVCFLAPDLQEESTRSPGFWAGSIFKVYKSASCATSSPTYDSDREWRVKSFSVIADREINVFQQSRPDTSANHCTHIRHYYYIF